MTTCSKSMQTCSMALGCIHSRFSLQVFTQYREHGVMMWRGYTIQQMAHQVSFVSCLTAEVPYMLQAVHFALQQCSAMGIGLVTARGGRCQSTMAAKSSTSIPSPPRWPHSCPMLLELLMPSKSISSKLSYLDCCLVRSSASMQAFLYKYIWS